MATPPGAYPTRTVTSAWTRDTAAFDAYAGACTDTDRHPTTEAGRTAAEDPMGTRICPPAARRHGPRPRYRARRQPPRRDRRARRPPSPRGRGRRPPAHRLVRAHLANEQPPRSYTTDSTPWVTSNPTEASRCNGGWERTMLIDDHQPNASDTERRIQQMPTKPDQRLTISVEEAGRLLGISRGLAYGACEPRRAPKRPARPSHRRPTSCARSHARPAGRRGLSPTGLFIGRQQDLPIGGQQRLPVHGHLATQRAGSGHHDSLAGALLHRHFGHTWSAPAATSSPRLMGRSSAATRCDRLRTPTAQRAPERLRSQAVIATASSSASDGDFQWSVCRGRPLSWSATASR